MMMTTSFLSLALLTFSVASSAAGPSARNALFDRTYGIPEGYTLTPMKFTGSIRGIDVDVEGTLQDVIIGLKLHNTELDQPQPISNETSTFVARDVKGTLCCPVAGQSWTPAEIYFVQEAIITLSKTPNLKCGVKARACSRIACQADDNSVFICNENNESISYSCQDVATHATNLIAKCTTRVGRDSYTCGQEFDTRGFNVVVAKQNCRLDAGTPPAAYSSSGRVR